MSNEVTIQDANALALREEMNRRLDDRVTQLDILSNSGASVAPTILIVQRRGGVGGSILGLTLEYLTKLRLLTIEIGGAPCPALSERSKEDYLHFPSSDPNRVDRALNARLRHASQPAILAFEPALYQRTLHIAIRLKWQVSPSSVMIFYIASQHDPYPQYATHAYNNGMHVHFCRQASQSWEKDPDGLLRLPWIDDSIVSRMMRGRLSLADALKQDDGLWTVNTTRANIEAFGTALWEADR